MTPQNKKSVNRLRSKIYNFYRKRNETAKISFSYHTTEDVICLLLTAKVLGKVHFFKSATTKFEWALLDLRKQLCKTLKIPIKDYGRS